MNKVNKRRELIINVKTEERFLIKGCLDEEIMYFERKLFISNEINVPLSWIGVQDKYFLSNDIISCQKTWNLLLIKLIWFLC